MKNKKDSKIKRYEGGYVKDSCPLALLNLSNGLSITFFSDGSTSDGRRLGQNEVTAPLGEAPEIKKRLRGKK